MVGAMTTARPLAGRADGPANAAMMELIARGLLVQAVAVAAQVGIPDLVADGPRPAEDIAAAVAADGDALTRLLRVLAGLGILTRDAEGRYGPTPLSRAIETRPGTVRDFALLVGEFTWEPWGHLVDSVRTGGSAFASLHGVGLFQHLQRDPADRARFQAWMSAQSAMQIPALLDAYDFGRFPTVVDVGGGHGGLLAAVLRAHPGVRGVLYDLPETVDGAEPLRAQDVAPRARIVGGDFFRAVPEGGDCYVLKLIVHDWGDERAGAILGSVRSAIPDDGTLLVVEHLLPSTDGFHQALFLDLNMLVLLGSGRERTPEEYEALLGRSGFRLEQVLPTASPLAILEARPA